MRTTTPVYERAEFIVELAREEFGGSWLVMTVAVPGRKRYVHTCTHDTFRAVCRWIDAHGTTGFFIRDIHHGMFPLDRPSTQVHVAISFLIERGILDKQGRRDPLHTLTDDVFADAMTEWHALLYQTTSRQHETRKVTPNTMTTPSPQPGDGRMTDESRAKIIRNMTDYEDVPRYRVLRGEATHSRPVLGRRNS